VLCNVNNNTGQVAVSKLSSALLGSYCRGS